MLIHDNVVSVVYVGQMTAKLIGGGGGYGMMSLDMNVTQQSLMMDPDCLSVCLIITAVTVLIFLLAVGFGWFCRKKYPGFRFSFSFLMKAL